MLVLTRKPQQTIVINGDITLTVLRVENGVVRLGIQAPAKIPVHRGEIQLKVNKDKAGTAPIAA